MNQEYRLKYCKVCDNKQFDPEQGLVCGLTREKPSFNESCESFTGIGNPVEQIYSDQTITKMINPVGRGKRFAHMIVDGIIFYVSLFMMFALIGVLSTFADYDTQSTIGEMLEGPMSYLIIYGFFVGFFFFWEALFMQTPGKMITKTVVVNEQGDKMAPGKIFGRSLSRLIPFDGFSYLVSDARGFHDRTVGAYVILKSDYDQIQELKQERESNRLVLA